MKIESTKDNLRRAVSFATKATGKKLPLQILGQILLEVKNKYFCIKPTNLDLGIEIKVSGKIQGEGRVAVSGTLLENHLNNLPEQTMVTLETTGNNLSITTPGSTTLITTLPAGDFPEIPHILTKGEMSISIDTSALVIGLRSVLYAASLTDLKPELSTVYLKGEEGELIFVATDSFRLAEKRITDQKFSPNEILEKGILIPLRNAVEIMRVLDESKGMTKVSFNKNQISFEAEGSYITSRLVEGPFPAYEHLLPKSFSTQIVVLKEDLISALRLVSVFSDRFHQIGVKIISEDALFELHSKNQDAGEATVKIDATIEGEGLDISLNARYLSDCFQIISKDSVSLGFNGKDKALLLRMVGDRSFSYLVMPLHK